MKRPDWTGRFGGIGAIIFAAALAANTSGASHEVSTCADLARLSIAGGAVTLAELVDGTSPPGAAANSRPLPAFCRVAATLKPSADSVVNVEVWMPVAGWNRKYEAVGNGAFNGTIAYPAMSNALARGYATSSTDTGHTGGSASFALGHPERVVDFGWRAVHEMTIVSKQIVTAFYGTAPQFSYWNGCSAGGRQAMKEAQRFPADFDGIVAGAPGLDWTGRASQAVRVAQALSKDEAARLPATHLQPLHRAVVEACDAQDGVKDGVLEDPKQCAFDPRELRCRGSDTAGCLTSAQVETARMLYAGAVNPKTKREIPGLERGSELGWTELGWSASARATGLDQFRFLVFEDPAWTIDRFAADTDIARAEDKDGGTINALDPNLKPFIDRGGKLIQYHGWNDPQISPGISTQYYLRVAAALGGADTIHGSYRLFMAPGMAHCGGGEGPNTFDMMTALEQWVEQGKAPDRIVASRSANGVVTRTRPLCPFPQVAAYNGTGSTDDAASFTCRATSVRP